MKDFLKQFEPYLRLRSKWTDEIIMSGFSTSLGILEETITDQNLIDIALKFRDFVRTKKFNKRQEGMESGADWLWCFGEPGCWITLAIQAKIINPKTQRCHYLNYGKGHQRILLRSYAKKHKFLPLYCIYSTNGISEEGHEKRLSNHSNFNNKDWACSLLTPLHIGKLVEKSNNKYENLLQFGIPWHFPFKLAEISDASSLALSIAQGFSLIRENIDPKTGVRGISDLWYAH